MTHDSSTKLVRITYRFSASAERVFDAWVDPAKACLWLFGTESGENVLTEIDARVGGRFEIIDRRDGMNVEHCGLYLELDRPRRLVFELLVPKYSTHVTRVSIDIVASPEGCELTLAHDGVLEDYIIRTESGWAAMLRRLSDSLHDAKRA